MRSLFAFSKKELGAFIILLVLSFFPRFLDLGYSNFYGDETKTLYTDKTLSAFTYFMDQRKGPVQFFVTWVMEKLTGGFSEYWIRFPFAVAGLLAVVVFYLLVKRFFGARVSLVASLLFSFSGFNIAFSRTAQYQNFLLLFGFLSFIFLTFYLETRAKKFLSLTAVFLALSFYSHYDAVFFVLPVVYFLYPVIRSHELSVKYFLIFFILPLILVLALFFVPYIYFGFFVNNAFNYIQRRFTGTDYLPNNSWYTFLVYNPVFSSALLLLFALIPVIARSKSFVINFFVLWFFTTFFGYEFLITNPGTHIHLYFIPLYILASLGFFEFLSFLKRDYLKKLLALTVFILLLITISSLYYVFIPALNKGYPWKDDSFLIFNLSKASKNYHLYLYGFPYKKPWQEVREYLVSLSGVKGFYTNDNEVVARYYVPEVSFTGPGTNFLPQYYVYIPDSQQLGSKDMSISKKDLLKYYIAKEFYDSENVSVIIYKLKDPLPQEVALP